MHPLIKTIEEVYPATRVNREKARYKKLMEDFCGYFSENAEGVRFFSAPGRTEICGNHTEKNCGRVFAASVDLDIITAAKPFDEETVIVKTQEYGEIKIDLGELEAENETEQSASAIVRGVLRNFKKKGNKIGGFRAYLNSEIIKEAELAAYAAFAVTIGEILNALFNEGQLGALSIARLVKFKADDYKVHRSPHTDRITCACGGFCAIDFKDSDMPIVEEIHDDFAKFEHALCIVEAREVSQRKKNIDLPGEFSKIENEMRQIAGWFDCESLRSLALEDIMLNINNLRREFGDRATLRTIHFFCENDRVEKLVHALQNEQFADFLSSVRESGNSSYKYLQNVYSSEEVRFQPLSVALNVASAALHRRGACRVHSDGFSGTIQAFVPIDDMHQFKMIMEKTFGIGTCHIMSIRSTGVCEVSFPA